MPNMSTIKEGARKAIAYLMLIVMVFNTVACDLQMDLRMPASMTVSPEPGLHEYAFDGTGGIGGQVQTISATWVAKDGTTSTSVQFEFPDDEGLVVQSNEGNGFASFYFTAPGYYVINASAIYNGQKTITKSVHYNVTSTITGLGLRTDKDAAEIGQTLRMKQGEVLTLIPVYTPSTSGTLGVSWQMGESGVITTKEVEVQSSTVSGRREKALQVKASQPGSTTITATSNDDEAISKEITVIVTASSGGQTTEASLIKLDVVPDDRLVELGQTATITATPMDGFNNPVSDQAVEWEVEDESVFSITEAKDNSVTVRAEKGGQTRIIAWFEDSTGKRIDSSVPLTTTGAIEGLYVTPSLGILIDQEEEVVPVEYYPEDTTQKGFTVTIAEGDEDIVSLVEQDADSFTIRPISRGVADITITSTADPSVSDTMTVTVDRELSTLDRIAQVKFDRTRLDFTTMSSETVSATTYVRNLQGVQEADDSLAIEFINESPDIISTTAQGNSVTITPLRPTKDGETARVTARSVDRPEFVNDLIITVAGDLVRLIPDTASVDLLMGTEGEYVVEAYPAGAIFTIPGEDAREGIPEVTLGIDSEAGVLESTSLSRSGDGLMLTVKAGTIPGSSTISFLKDDKAIGEMEVTTTIAEDYVKAVSLTKDGQSVPSLQLKQDADPVDLTVTLIDSKDQPVKATASAYDFSVEDGRVVDVVKNDGTLTIIPKNAGTTVVEVQATSNSAAVAQVYVEVGGAAVQGDDLRGITLSKDSMTLGLDNADTITYTILPYSAEDDTLVTVQATGAEDGSEIVSIETDHEHRQTTVVGLKEGESTLTFTAKQGTVTKTATAKVKVTTDGDWYSIVLDRDYLSYDLNQRLAQTVTATVYRNGVVDTTSQIEWSIGNDEIGTVTPAPGTASRSAVVGYKAKGTTWITATVKDHPDASASMVLEVIDSEVIPTTIRSIVLGQSAVTVPLGRELPIDWSVIPSSLQDKAKAKVTFTSSDETVATVNGNGTVKAEAIGRATITATVDPSLTGDSLVRSSMTVNVVRDATSASYIELSDSSVVLDQEDMDTPMTVTATVRDRNGKAIDDASVEWRQSAYSRTIVSMNVNDDNSISLTPVTAGATTITASYPGLTSVTLHVTVGEETSNARALESLVPNVRELDMFLANDDGRTFNVYVTPVPADVTSSITVEWSSSDPDVATVQANADDSRFAKVTATGKGNTQIIAKVKDTSIQTIIEVDVTDEAPGKVTAISLSPTSVLFDLNSRELTQIRATIYYDGVVDNTQPVTWTVDKSLDGAITADTSTTGQHLRIAKGSKEGEGFITATVGGMSASTAVEVVASSGEVALTALSLSTTSLTIDEGQKSIIYANPYPSAAATQQGYSLSWDSLDDGIATVDDTGLVTGVSAGTTQLEATAKLGDATIKASVKVTVRGEDEAPGYIELSDSSVVLSQEDMDKATIVSATVRDASGAEVADAEVEWHASTYAQSIVRLEDGDNANEVKLYPVSAGTATVTASYPGLSTVNLMVTVGSDIANTSEVERLVPSPASLALWTGDEVGRSFNVRVTPVPADTTEDLDIEWTSSDKTVATVTPNAENALFAKVDAVAPGNAQIIAKVAGTNIQAVIDVSVTETAPDKVTAILVSPESVVFDLNSRELTQLKATVYFNGVVDNSQSVTWTVDEALAASGAITYDADQGNGQYFRIAKGTKVGEGYITATSGGMSASSYISTVDTTGTAAGLGSLRLSSSSVELGIGQKSVVYATPVPASAADEAGYKVEWESDDPDVVTVDNGYLTGVADGVATVTATASLNGVQRSAKVAVRVSSDLVYPSRLIISPSIVRFASSASADADVSAEVIMSDGQTHGLGDGEELVWTVADSSVATVVATADDKGATATISPVREGTTSVTARYGTLSANVGVEVGSSVESAATAPTKITLTSSTGGLLNPPGSASDTTSTISVEYLPYNLAQEYKGVSWSIDGETYARILTSNDHTATITAVSPGTATVTAASLADPEVKSSITLTVLDEEVVIPRISLDRTNLVMDLQDCVTVNATVTREGVVDESGTVTFSNDSTDDGISFEAVGDRGYRITTDTEQTSSFTVRAEYPVGAGDAKVAATLPVTVSDPSVQGQPLRAVSISEDSLVMSVGETRDLDFTVEPRIFVTSEWKSSAPQLATVDQNGLVSAKDAGQVEVSVTVEDEFGNSLSDTVSITVTDEIRPSSRFSALTASENAITRSVRDLPYQFTLELLDAEGNVDNQTGISEVKAFGVDGAEIKNGDLFTWRLIGSPERTVELSDFKPGSAYLRFTVYDDEMAEGQKAGVSTYVYITVTGEVRGIAADTKYMHMAVGDSERIAVTYSPTNAVPDDGVVKWTVEEQKPSDGGSGAVVEILDPTSTYATVRALALGTAKVKASYGDGLSATVDVSVEDIASLSGGVRKVTFDSGFMELGYPYTRTPVQATVHFNDGSTSNEGITYSWGGQADSAVATLMTSGGTAYITPVGDGEATLVATYGDGTHKAEMKVFVKGSVASISPSVDTMTIYTGGSARISVTPDIEGVAGTRYGWRVVKETYTVPDGDGQTADLVTGGSVPSALTNILTDPNDDNSQVVVAARSVVVDPDNSRYDESLIKTYPRTATIEAYLIDNPSVKTSMTVNVELLPIENSYPTSLTVDFSSITTPDLESYNQVSGTLVDDNGAEVDGHIDWYWYPLGDDTWDEPLPSGEGDWQTATWIDPNVATSNLDLLAYAEENARTVYIKPQRYGIYRIKAICRENPALQQSATVNIEGDVESIIDSAGGSLNVTEDGDWVTLTATFDPEPVLRRDAFFILGSYKNGQTNGAKAYNEDDNMRFIVNGNTIQIFGKAVTSEPMPLNIEYWDAETREDLEAVAAGDMTYAEATKDGTLIATTTVMVRVVPPEKSIATIAVSGLDLSIDPSSITGPISFTVDVSGGNWSTDSSSGGEDSDSFSEWGWLEIDIVGSDSENAGQTVIYASTTPSRVNAPASIATGGRINLVNGTASFTLVKSAIPNEPMKIRVDLKDDCQDGVLNNPNGNVDGTEGTVIFDSSRVGFNRYESLLYIGGQVTNLNPGTTEFTNNGNTTTATGQVINMITGALATIKVEYNPSYTHQKGTVWYTPDVNAKDRLVYSFISNGNTNECAVDGVEDSNGPVVLRAMSIYDPWFDYRAEELGVPVETYRAAFLATSHDERLVSDRYRYPNTTDDVQPTIYLDFQVTVSSPIDKAIFTAKSQRQTNKDSTQAPSYVNLNDPVNHPDIISETDIYCYDTSDATTANETGSSVDAYFIEAELEPEYGYTLVYSQVSGSAIGSIDTITEIDEDQNAFRFIPKGKTLNPDGTYSIAYGDVVIRATSAAQNFSQDFVLHYLPSNMRIVKYVGEKTVDGLQVPADEWLDEWDVVALNGNQKSLYGMETIVLKQKGVSSDPDVDDELSRFPVSIVSYVENSPYYITNGVQADTTDGGELLNRYAIRFTLMQGSDVSGDEWKSDIAHFETPDGRNLGNETDFLTYEDLDEPYVDIVADKQGIAYLAYTIISLDEEGEIIEGSGSMNGGVMVYIVSPMDQVLAALIDTSSNASRTYNYAVLIPEKISKAQDDLWFLGPEKGGIGEVALTSDGQESGQLLYRGRAYASFTLPEGETVPGVVFDIRKEVASMKSLSNLNLEIDTKALEGLAIREGGQVVGAVPTMGDVIITGDTGLSLLDSNDGITSLAITDVKNGLWKANIVNGVYDLGGIRSLRTYQHTGMAVSGDRFTLRMPPKLEKLNLSGNNLDNAIDWNGSAATLTSVDLSDNSYRTVKLALSSFKKLATFTMEDSSPLEVKISDAPVLTEVNVESDRKIGTTTAASSLIVTGTPKLTEVNASDTQFKTMSLEMSSAVSRDNKVSVDSGDDLAKLTTLTLTGGYVDTLDASDVPSLVTIDAGKADINWLQFSGSEDVATIRVNSVTRLTTPSPENSALSEFSFNTLGAGANIELLDFAKLTAIGTRSGYSFNVPAGTKLTLGGSEPSWNTVEDTGESEINPANRSELVTIKFGKVDGDVTLQYAKRLDVLESGEGAGSITATESGLKSFSKVKSGVRALKLDRSKDLIGDVTINGGINESIQELSLNNCPITSITVTASSGLEKLEAYGSGTITGANIQASNIKHIDMHDNQLGTKDGIQIGDILWKKKSIGSGSGNTYSSWGIPSLTYLNLSGNKIVFSTSMNYGGGHGMVGKFKLGSGLSSSHKLAMKKYWYEKNIFTNGGNSYLSISGTAEDGSNISLSSNHYNQNGEHFWFISNDPKYDNAVVSVNSTMEATSWGNDMYIRLAPFGDNLNTSEFKTSSP